MDLRARRSSGHAIPSRAERAGLNDEVFPRPGARALGKPLKATGLLDVVSFAGGVSSGRPYPALIVTASADVAGLGGTRPDPSRAETGPETDA